MPNIFPSMIKISDLNLFYVLLYDYDSKRTYIRGYNLNGLFFAQTDGQDTFQTDYIMNCKDDFLQVLRAYNVFKKELKIAKNINSLKSQINDIFLNYIIHQFNRYTIYIIKLRTI